MTTTGKAKVVQYLAEAHAGEEAWSATLAAHIVMTPSGSYRTVLERQRADSQRHAQRVERRLRGLGGSSGQGPVGAGVGVVAGVMGKVAAVAKAPLDLVRGGSGEEKMVKNAKDQAAALEHTIVTYRALGHLARATDDTATAELADSIAGDKENGLGSIEDALDGLVDAVVRSEIRGKSSYDPSRTGAAQTVGRLADEGREAVSDAGDEVRRQARQARKIPGVARSEGELKGALADADDLRIAHYDDLTAEEIIGQLSSLSQVDLAKIDAYERKNDNRVTVLNRISSLRGDEPWPGYDELTVADIRKALTAGDDDLAGKAAAYERRHKDRTGVIDAVEAERSNS